MSVGKYSPTVTVAYINDRHWFDKLSQGTDGDYDVDGYDRYGYNIQDVDRAGYSESDYFSSYIDSINEGGYHLANRISDEWSFKDGKPSKIV